MKATHTTHAYHHSIYHKIHIHFEATHKFKLWNTDVYSPSKSLLKSSSLQVRVWLIWSFSFIFLELVNLEFCFANEVELFACLILITALKMFEEFEKMFTSMLSLVNESCTHIERKRCAGTRFSFIWSGIFLSYGGWGDVVWCAIRSCINCLYKYIFISWHKNKAELSS